MTTLLLLDMLVWYSASGYTLLLLNKSDVDGKRSLAGQLLRRASDVHEDQSINRPEDQDPQDQKTIQRVARSRIRHAQHQRKVYASG